MKRVRFTVLTAMRCSTIQTISDCWIAMKKVVTRTRQTFFDLYIFPVFNNILHCTLMQSMKRFRPIRVKAKFTQIFHYKITIINIINLLTIYDDK